MTLESPCYGFRSGRPEQNRQSSILNTTIDQRSSKRPRVEREACVDWTLAVLVSKEQGEGHARILSD
jgi:hypothetical protein